MRKFALSFTLSGPTLHARSPAMENKLSSQIIEAAIEVHQHLGGPGLLETIYEAALCHELSLRGLHTQRQLPIPVTYKNIAVRDPLFSISWWRTKSSSR